MGSDCEGTTQSGGVPTAASAVGGGPCLPVEGLPWGKFLILKRLGGGGQAEVFRAFDQTGPLGEVALRIPAKPVPPTQVQSWIDTEVKALATLDHPNIVKVREAAVHDSTPYIASQLVDGLPLNAHAKANPPSLSQILDWMTQLADALHHAHTRGVVHRDIKPPNIVMDPMGTPLVLDFGLATLVSAYQPERTADGHIAGTVPFMAPEQAARPREVDHQADIFGLGGVLKFLLEGNGPYGPKPSLEAVAAGKVEFADESKGPTLRRALARVANRALAPDPQQRYRTAGEMARAFRWMRRRRAVIACTAAAAVALAAIVGAALLLWPHPQVAPVPSAASLEIHFQRAGQRGSYGVLTPEAVPLRTGDRIQVHATFRKPLVAYLIAASSTGQPTILYPPKGKEAGAVTELHVPAGRDEWLPLTSPPGTETLVLLARRVPLADPEAFLARLSASGPAPSLSGPAILIVDEQGVRLHEQGTRVIAGGSVTSRKGFLAVLVEQVPQEWAVLRAIAFTQEPAVDGTGGKGGR